MDKLLVETNLRSVMEQALMHVENLLYASVPPELPVLPEDTPGRDILHAIHDYLVALRTLLQSFAKGDIDREISLRGSLAGSLKALHASLSHLTWQIQQVAEGDFTQRVDFMGNFSTAFNSMVAKLDYALTELRLKEEELIRLSAALQNEVNQKTEILEALRKSEASFRYRASHDALTGVLNRRSFYDMAVMELERAKQAGEPCCLAFFDIDNFKRFNDEYGHIAGDAAIRHTTTVSKKMLRQQDIIGRFGGDEIVLFFPSVDKTTGSSIAERLRATIARTPVKISAEKSAPMTISVGLSFISPDLQRKRAMAFLEKVISHADSALYVAKNAGRNIVAAGTFPDEDFVIVKRPQVGTIVR